MESSKRCPYCAEPIAEAAIKCQGCGQTPEPTPPPHGELIKWQYKVVIAILITGLILLYNAPKNAPAAPSRVSSSPAHSAAQSASIRSLEPARSAVPPPVPQALTPSPLPASAGDVETAAVQAISPNAAQRIRSYCAKATAGSGSGDESLTSCEHREIVAWDRVVLEREFPPHDPSLDRKCSERPFPADGFVAYEACLRVELKGR